MCRVCWSLLLLVCLLPASASGQFIVAHRGASFDAPENTLAAFELAWEQGADAIEGDFYLTADGEIVCIHDKTTKRVAPATPEVSVAKTTFEKLRQLDVGSWKHPRFSDQRIPTLEEVLATIPEGKRIFLEIKCGPEIIEPLKEKLASSKLNPEQVVIIAFSTEVIEKSRRLMPQYQANWLTSYKQKDKQSEWKPTKKGLLQTLKETKATGLGTNGNLQVITPALIDSVRALNREFHVWTVNDADAARAFQKMEVDSITTDRPAYIRNILKQQTPVETK